MRIRLHPLHEADGGTSATGTGDGGQGNPSPTTAASGTDPLAAFQNLLSRSSDAAALARQLFDENYRYREQLREAQRQIPAQGTALLPPEQAQAWQQYQQLGTLADVQRALKERETAQGELTTLKRDLELRDVASAAGYSLDVLRTLAGDLAFSVKDEQKDGKPIKAVYVTVDGKDLPVDVYAAEKWAAFLPALRPTQTGAPALGATNPAVRRGDPPVARFDPKNPPRLSSIEWKK